MRNIWLPIFIFEKLIKYIVYSTKTNYRNEIVVSSTLQNTKLIYSLNICGLCSKCFYNGVLKPKTLILRLTYLSYMGSKEVNEAICGVDCPIIGIYLHKKPIIILSNKEPDPLVIRRQKLITIRYTKLDLFIGTFK